MIRGLLLRERRDKFREAVAGRNDGVTKSVGLRDPRKEVKYRNDEVVLL